MWARTRVGRALMVALRHVAGRDRWIAGARELTPAEPARLEDWEARDE